MKVQLPSARDGQHIVSIPLPGFIVMKALVQIFGRLGLSLCFNPVAGIHCNERSGLANQSEWDLVSIPLPGFIVMKGARRAET